MSEKEERYFIEYDSKAGTCSVVTYTKGNNDIWFKDKGDAEKIVIVLNKSIYQLTEEEHDLAEQYRNECRECSSHISKAINEEIRVRNGLPPRGPLPNYTLSEELDKLMKQARDTYCEQRMTFNKPEIAEKKVDIENKSKFGFEL